MPVFTKSIAAANVFVEPFSVMVVAVEAVIRSLTVTFPVNTAEAPFVSVKSVTDVVPATVIAPPVPALSIRSLAPPFVMLPPKVIAAPAAPPLVVLSVRSAFTAVFDANSMTSLVVVTSADVVVPPTDVIVTAPSEMMLPAAAIVVVPKNQGSICLCHDDYLLNSIGIFGAFAQLEFLYFASRGFWNFLKAYLFGNFVTG